MKFVISSTELYHHLSIAYGAITKNPVVAILENFLFELQDGKLKIIASTLDVTIVTSTTDVEIAEEGSLAVKANILIDTLRDMPEQPLEFEVLESNEGTISLHSTHGNYKIPTEPAEDFPDVPQIVDTAMNSVDSEILQDAIDKTLFATSSDEMRLSMSGLYFDLSENDFRIVATDAHKLVKYHIDRIESAGSESAIVPKKAVRTLKGLLSNSEKCNFIFDTTSAYFILDDIQFVSRIIKEKYPNYSVVIPQKVASSMTIDRLDLLSSLKRTSNFANKTTNQVYFDIEENQLSVFTKDLDFNSEAVETLNCEYSSDEKLKISFNSIFLVEMLQSHDVEKLRFDFTSERTACLIYPDVTGEDKSILNLIMPVAYKN